MAKQCNNILKAETSTQFLNDEILGNAEMVQMLIYNGAEINGRTKLSPRFHGTIPTNNETALHLAAANSESISRRLLEQFSVRKKRKAKKFNVSFIKNYHN